MKSPCEYQSNVQRYTVQQFKALHDRWLWAYWKDIYQMLGTKKADISLLRNIHRILLFINVEQSHHLQMNMLYCKLCITHSSIFEKKRYEKLNRDTSCITRCMQGIRVVFSLPKMRSSNSARMSKSNVTTKKIV